MRTTEGVCRQPIQLWDAQIWAAARLNQIPLVFTEDIQAQVVVEGVRFDNPFAVGFRLEDWLHSEISESIRADEVFVEELREVTPSKLLQQLRAL